MNDGDHPADIEELLAQSSLNTPSARSLRHRVTPDDWMALQAKAREHGFELGPQPSH